MMVLYPALNDPEWLYGNTWEAHIKQQHVDNFFDVLPVVDVWDQQDASVVLKSITNTEDLTVISAPLIRHLYTEP